MSPTEYSLGVVLPHVVGHICLWVAILLFMYGMVAGHSGPTP